MRYKKDSGARSERRAGRDQDPRAGRLAENVPAWQRWRAAGRPDTEDSPRSRQLLRLTDPPAEADPSTSGRISVDGDPLVAYDGNHWRMRADGSLQRWNAAARAWTSLRRDQWSEDAVTYLTDEGAARRRVADLTRADSSPAVIRPGSASVGGCTCLGGDLPSLCVYGKYVLAVRRDALELRSRQAGTTTIPFDDVVDVRIGGRGRLDVGSPGRTSFGLAGFREGMAAAAVVRSLVERTRMDTSITIDTSRGDAVFHCDRLEPDQVRTILSRVAAHLRRRSASNGTRGRVDPTRDLVHLADLKTRGLLTEQEFASAVAAALDGTL